MRGFSHNTLQLGLLQESIKQSHDNLPFIVGQFLNVRDLCD
jgi:hypothetical protein